MATAGVLPDEVAALVDAALVAELTVLDSTGRPISYPLIPLYDGTRIYMTCSALFSKKLRHIKANPKVSVAFTDPIGVPAVPFARATIQGHAVVEDGDLHSDWERLLPLWRAKEPVIDKFVKMRFGIPLFFERSVIVITPLRVTYWPGGATDMPPQVIEMQGAN
jgi:general stress protein 26